MPSGGIIPGVAIGTCCCLGGGGVVCCSCRTLTTLGREWNFTIAGIVNNACAFCADYNGNFTLHWGPTTTGCLWGDWRNAPPGCNPPVGGDPNACTFHNTWLLVGDETYHSGYNLYPNAGLITEVPRYNLPLAQWNCAGPNVMNLVFSGELQCASWPATVTLTRGVGIIPVCQCWPPYDVIAVSFTARLAGFVGDPDCCQAINGDHVLVRGGPDTICQDNTPGREFCQWNKRLFLGGACAGRSVCISLQTEFSVGRIFLTLVSRDPPPPFFDYYDTYFLPQAQFNPVGPNTFIRVPSNVRCAPGQWFGSRMCTTTPFTVEVNAN